MTEAPSAMSVMRRTTRAFASSTVFFVPLAITLDRGRSDVPAAPVVVALVAVGVFALVATGVLVPRLPADPDDLTGFLEQYRLKHLARLGWSMLPLLAALGAVALMRNGWVYVIGVVPAAVGFALAAPTRLPPERRRTLEEVVMGSPD